MSLTSNLTRRRLLLLLRTRLLLSSSPSHLSASFHHNPHPHPHRCHYNKPPNFAILSSSPPTIHSSSSSSSSSHLFHSFAVAGLRSALHPLHFTSSAYHHRFKSFNGSFLSRRYSGGPDLFNATTVLWTLIGTNVAVYLMWQQMNLRFMDKHFTVSVDSVLSGRLYTILTSAFSQRDGSHLLSNMIGLYFFGSEIGRTFGGKYLLTIYVAGAVGGSFGHLLYYTYIYPWLQKTPRYFYNPRYSPTALGASGAVTSIMLLNIFLHPKQIIFFQMFIPMPAALLGLIIIGRDLWLAKQGDTDVSGPAHLGGALVAFLAFLKISSELYTHQQDC